MENSSGWALAPLVVSRPCSSSVMSIERKRSLNTSALPLSRNSARTDPPFITWHLLSRRYADKDLARHQLALQDGCAGHRALRKLANGACEDRQRHLLRLQIVSTRLVRPHERPDLQLSPQGRAGELEAP